MHSAGMVLDRCVIAYGILKNLRTDNRSLSASRVFETMSGSIGVRQLTTTAYHTLTNGQAKRLKKP